MTRTIPDMATVALAVTDGMLHFELSVAYEVFGAAPAGVADPWYDVAVCGPDAVRIGRFRLEPDLGLDRLQRADTVIVPAWADVDEDPPADLVDAVRAAHEAGARVASLCTGAFVLAAAGLLDGKRATTHWAHTGALAARYPQVEVDPDVLYVDNGSVLTSAGKAARWTCACTSSASTTARRSPTPSPAASSCRRTGPAARPSSSPPQCPPKTTTRSRRCSPG
jgi:AraC family transcriptional regulator, transcriptional activator FtrA